MDLNTYIENHRGTGVLSTASADGTVNGAVYARPRVLGDDTVGFIMRDRLSRANLQENGHAHYLFMEEGGKSHGIRLHLDMIWETGDPDKISSFVRRQGMQSETDNRYLVTFKIRKVLQLVGGEEIDLDRSADSQVEQ